MAYDLAMDMSTGDLVLKDGDLLLIDNAERVMQQVLISLREWLGEWFLNTRDGVPYLEYILVKNPNENHIRQVLSDAILVVEGVESITSMGFYLQQGITHADGRIRSKNGLWIHYKQGGVRLWRTKLNTAYRGRAFGGSGCRKLSVV